MNNNQLSDWVLNRFEVDKSNKEDMKTLYLRGVSGCFKPENEQEQQTVQRALANGASVQLSLKQNQV